MKARIYTASMFVLLAIVAAVALADWPEFLGPNRNAMVKPKEKLAQSWPEKGPKLHWQFDLEPGYGGAAVKDGRVYIMDREGKERDLVYCIDLKTGKEVWKFSYEAKGSQKFQGARAVPAVDDKRVYTVGPFGHVHCLDRKSKQVVWAKSYKDDFGIRSVRWGHASAPLLYKEWVILAPQSKTVGIVACERETGKVAWKSPSVGEAAHSSPKAMTLDGVEQIVLLARKKLVGIEPKTGKRLWEYGDFRCLRPIHTPLKLGDDKLLLTSGYTMGAHVLRVKKDGEQWTVKKEAGDERTLAFTSNPVLHDGHIYAVANDRRATDGMICLTPDLKLKWKTDSKPGFGWGAILLVGDRLFAVDDPAKAVVLIDPNAKAYRETGRWAGLSGSALWAPMAYSDGKLLVRDQKTLHCLDVTAGEVGK